MSHNAISYPRLPMDRELDELSPELAEQYPARYTAELIPLIREQLAAAPDTTAELFAEAGVTRRDTVIKGYDGADIAVTVASRADHRGAGPGLYHIHGGGMMVGNRNMGPEAFLSWIVDHDAVLVSVEYRLAPEFPDPYPVEDCYAGLVWTAENAAELGIDADRIVVLGQSAGGGLSAGVALLARDRAYPQLRGQVLAYPMLDDRHETASMAQCADALIWSRESSEFAWDALLADQRTSGDISVYAAPARASDLAGLPPAYIDCGSSELFRDECIAYADALWKAGVQAELHVWGGAFHGFDMIAPDTAIARSALAARAAWFARLMGP